MKKNVTVTTIPSQDETFARALGITRQREEEIDNLMDQFHRDTDTYPGAIAGISQQLHNANELAYACFHLGAFAESQRKKQELLHKLLD